MIQLDEKVSSNNLRVFYGLYNDARLRNFTAPANSRAQTAPWCGVETLSNSAHNSNATEQPLEVLIQGGSKFGNYTVHQTQISNDDEVFFIVFDFITARRMKRRRIRTQ